jgi:AcrR family transcriptional regulator
MRADILRAAVRVLEREKGDRFTTPRIAEACGVSVGSLYQYFPNKESILWALQLEEWQATARKLDALLAGPGTPAEVLTRLIQAFFESERAERRYRRALQNAIGSSLRSRPEHRRLERGIFERVRDFLARANTKLAGPELEFRTRLVIVTVGSIAERVSESAQDRRDLGRWVEVTTRWILQETGLTQRARPPAP